MPPEDIIAAFRTPEALARCRARAGVNPFDIPFHIGFADARAARYSGTTDAVQELCGCPSVGLTDFLPT